MRQMDLRYQSKSRLQYFSRKNKNISLVIYDQALALEKQFKYLGIVFQENGLYSAHARYIQEKCSKRINILRMLCAHSAYAFCAHSAYALDDMVKLQIAMFVHRHFNNDIPSNLRGYFTNVNKYHSIATRRQTIGYNYHIPRYRSSKLQRSIKYLGVSVWNAIPVDIRECYSRRFKRKFKNLIIEGY